MDSEQFSILIKTLTESLQCSQKSSSPEVIPLEPFCEETETWDIFIKRLEKFFNMKSFTGTLAEIDNKKKEWLIHSMGTKTLQLLYNLTTPDDPKILNKEHLHPKPSVIVKENRFTRRIQQVGESISDFVADLKKLSRNCDFRCLSCNASTADKHLRQQFISGLKNSSWLEKLIQLKEPNNTFFDYVQTALEMESAHKDSKEIQALQSSSMSIYQNQLKFSQNFKRSSPNPFKRFCFRCGDESHLANVCKHVRSHCGRCGRVGHLDAVCRNGKPMTNHPSVKPTKKFVKSNNQNQIHPVTQPSSSEVIVENDSDHEFYYINNIVDCMLPESERKPDKFLLDVHLDDKHVEMEYDTGAVVSSISYDMFKELFPNKQIHTSELPLKTYTGEIIKPIGYSTFEASYCGQKVLANLYILPGEVEFIFGREWLKDIRIIPPEIHQVQVQDEVDGKLWRRYLGQIAVDWSDNYRNIRCCSYGNISPNEGINISTTQSSNQETTEMDNEQQEGISISLPENEASISDYSSIENSDGNKDQQTNTSNTEKSNQAVRRGTRVRKPVQRLNL
ncbi:uncharacterized protein [Leptinotarsa decemlineata]|uniref:uncharacterized protein n=1 Tax=Leptinotarsa decemlineata TaxID=7539 RepID=UPI003D3041C2